jgi:hypothetical protein
MIQSGTLHYNVDTRGWDLASGSRERWLEPPDIEFETPIATAPKVVLILRSRRRSGLNRNRRFGGASRPRFLNEIQSGAISCSVDDWSVAEV